MQNKTAVLAIIICILLSMLVFAGTDAYYSMSLLSGLSEASKISLSTEDTFWATVGSLNNVGYAVLLLFSVISLIVVVVQWNRLDFYNAAIIEHLRRNGWAFLLFGAYLTLFHLTFTGSKELLALPISEFNIQDHEAFAISAIGLFFLLSRAILLNAKLLKEENDLTI